MGPSLEFNLVFSFKISQSYCVLLQFKHFFCSILHLKLYPYFSMLWLLLELSRRITCTCLIPKWYIFLFCNHLILDVTWRAIIKRFDFILRHASLKLSRYTAMFVNDIEALYKRLVYKFDLFSFVPSGLHWLIWKLFPGHSDYM